MLLEKRSGFIRVVVISIIGCVEFHKSWEQVVPCTGGEIRNAVHVSCHCCEPIVENNMILLGDGAGFQI